MDQNLVVEQKKLFAAEKAAFEAATARYLDACRTYNYFGDEQRLLDPPIARAVYSDRMAWIMAKMAKLAYVEFEKNPQVLARLEIDLESGGFELVKTFAQADTQAFLVKTKTYAILAFRGTQTSSIGDIETDIRANMLTTINGRVHIGFQAAYALIADDINASISKIYEDINANISKIDKLDLPLYITGHSLGAALATIATQALERKFPDRIAACYTFGSPRVGNAEFDFSLKSPFYRIVNATDGVTLIPFIAMGYTHVGDARYLTRSGNLWRGVPLRERIRDIAISITMSLWPSGAWILGPFISAHSMDEYIVKLEKIAEDRNKIPVS
jgi:triacylglycerol lipase